jgi:transposase
VAPRPGAARSPGPATWRCAPQLVESAWAYRYLPNVSAGIRRRQQGVDPATIARSWAAQTRLSRRWRHLAARKDSQNTVAAAIARELAGFVWAEMIA